MKHTPSRLQAAMWTSIIGLSLLFYLWIGHLIITPRMPLPTKPIEFYSIQMRDDLQLTFSEAIKSAKSSVVLLIYSLTDRKIIQALRKKSEEGVSVQVICDEKASRTAPRKLGPKVRTTLRKSRGLMHQKILVIDGINTWIGSANMTPTSLKLHDNLVIGLHSRDFAKQIEKKVHHMTTTGRIYDIPASTCSVGNQRVEVWFFPDNTNGVDKLTQLIQGAEKSIKVAMFTWTRHDLAQAIIKARERGVDTHVVIDRNSANGVSKKVVNFLTTHGIHVQCNAGASLLHHKLLIIDDNTLVNGSANWTKAAFTVNDDCFMILHDLNDRQRRYLRQLWSVMIAEADDIHLEEAE